MSRSMKLHSWFFAALVVAAVGLVPRHAAALRIVRTPIFGGNATLGVLGTSTWLAVQPPSGGTCTFFLVSNVAHLNDDLEVYGSEGSDWIQVVRAPGTNACGAWQPVNYDGHSVDIYGQGGADVIIGGPDIDYIHGGSGDDLIYGNWIAAFVDGNDGNDYIYGYGAPFDSLSGGNGNDHLCEHSQYLVLAEYGGAGTNTRCGSAVYMDNTLTKNCSICGSGY